MIENLFHSGHVADLVLAVMAGEVLFIFFLVQRSKIHFPFQTYIFGVIAGAFIIIGLREALIGGSYLGIALALALSFAAHIAELISFLRRNKCDPNDIDSSYKYRSKLGTDSKKGL